MEVAGRHFGKRLAKNAAALHDLESTHQQAGANISAVSTGTSNSSSEYAAYPSWISRSIQSAASQRS
jgi:hypothetical protein